MKCHSIHRALQRATTSRSARPEGGLSRTNDRPRGGSPPQDAGLAPHVPRDHRVKPAAAPPTPSLNKSLCTTLHTCGEYHATPTAIQCSGRLSYAAHLGGYYATPTAIRRSGRLSSTTFQIPFRRERREGAEKWTEERRQERLGVVKKRTGRKLYTLNFTTSLRCTAFLHYARVYYHAPSMFSF